MRRRTKGTGSVIRRADGRYEARYQGRAAMARSEREAERLLAQLVAGVYQPRRRSRPDPVPDATPTLQGFIPRYLAHCRLQGVSEETLRGTYGPSLDRVATALGPVALTAITPEDVTLALAAMSERYSAGTVHMARAALKRCLSLAEDWELIDRNPVRSRAPKAAPRTQPRITIQRAQAIRDAVCFTRAWGPVTLGLYLGLRFGEVLGLRWEDIEDDAILIRGQTLRTQVYKPRTKSGRERILPLIAPVAAAFRVAKQQQAEDSSAQGNRWQDTGFIFTGPRGRPLSRAGLRWTLDHRLELAGVARTTFHGLRHMTATLLHDLGVSEEVRRSILGHASADVHYSYVHVGTAAQREALSRLERALE